MADTSKDTIYIDIDDEITGIIDKVQGSKKHIVALVLPKRATVLQSIVNMRLLKRTADASKKRLVLITSEAGLLPLAGAVGLHVAKTLQSKPAIPPGPEVPPVPEGTEDEDVDLDNNAPIGQLAGMGAAAAAGAAVAGDDEETIEIDNDTATPATSSGKKSKQSKKDGYNKKLKVPNFEKFRVWIFAGIGGVIALIVLFFLMNSVLPKATITITTDTSTANSDVTFTATPNQTTFNVDKQIVPATKKEYKKADTEKIAASGTKDKGTKATGSVTMSTQTNCASPVGSVPAGTSVSSNGLNFITGDNASFSPSGFSGGKCIFTSNSVSVTAQSPGDQYNLSARSYTVAGYPAVTAQGGAMSGGTSNIVKVVTQADVDAAKQKILDRDVQAANDELKKQIKADGKFAIVESSSAGTPTVTTSPNVGDEANEVTVNTTTTYTMYGVKEDDLKKLVDADLKGKIDTSKQGISDYGLDKATFKVIEKPANGDMKLDMQTTVVVGLRPDVDAIRKAVAGKKKGDTKDTISAMPGVNDVTIKYSPFWVYKTPSKQSRITVNFEKSNDQQQ